MTKAYVVAGLGFGDEGKGTMVDYLTRRHDAKLVVRYNGGCQAAHNVVTPEGVHHTFSQFGAGTLAGAYTYLSKYMLVDPLRLLKEASILSAKGIQNPLGMLSVSPECTLITPLHATMNRLRELSRGGDAHGSVGVGVGEARMDELAGNGMRLEDLHCPDKAARKFNMLRDMKVKEAKSWGVDTEAFNLLLDYLDVSDYSDWSNKYAEFVDWVRMVDFDDALDFSHVGRKDSIVFEGAQGVLLDETHGFAPHNTWTDTTFNNASTLLRECGIDKSYQVNVGVIRSYYTRHGAGPFPTEDSTLQVPELHNVTHPWMGGFRQGHFDYHLFSYAQSVSPCDQIAITHMDCRPSKKVKLGLEPDTSNPVYINVDYLPNWLDIQSSAPVAYTSHGPTYLNKQEY